MSRLIVGLTGTTLAFAASTFYFAYQLGVEREKNLRTTMPAARSQPARPQSSAGASPGADTLNIESPHASDDEPDASPLDPGQAAITRDRLEQLRSPAGRAERARQLVILFREDWRSMAPHIGIAPDELDRVLADLAEQTMLGMEKRFECQLDPACDRKALDAAPGMSQDDRIAATLGPARYARYREFQESWAERSTVNWMSQQLGPAKALTDAASEKLVQVLAEQRRQFVREAEARGEKVEQEGGFLNVRSAAAAGASDEYARRKESATAYTRRSVELVSGLLTSEQLAWFRDAADSQLYAYTERLRRAEIADSARKAARP